MDKKKNYSFISDVTISILLIKDMINYTQGIYINDIWKKTGKMI